MEASLFGTVGMTDGTGHRDEADAQNLGKETAFWLEGGPGWSGHPLWEGLASGSILDCGSFHASLTMQMAHPSSARKPLPSPRSPNHSKNMTP